MFPPGIPTSRSIAWNTHGRAFRFTQAGDRLILDCSDGRMTLSLHEWQGVAAALAQLHPPAPSRIAGGSQDRGGRVWMESEDADLCRGWYGGEGIAALSARFGRSEEAIAARLVHLDLVDDRAQARSRP